MSPIIATYLLACTKSGSPTPVLLHASPRAKGKREEKKGRAKIGEWQRSIMMHCGGQARPIARPAGGKTRRRGRRVGRRGVGEEGRRPCPQLRTGYVKQPGRPADRCVRLTCPPALLLPCLHDGQKELAGMPRPSKSQFFVPCHFRLFPIESSIKASHYVPPFFFFQLHPFRAGFQGLLPRSPFVENSYSSSFRVLLKII